MASSIETLSGTADPTAPSATVPVTASSSLAGTEVPILPDSKTPVGVSVSGPGGQTDPLKSNGKPVTGNGNGNGKGRLLQTNTTNATAGLVDVDWSDKTGYVKTQGACGACYAFAAVGAFESALAIKIFGGLHVAFSVQQIIDCTVLPTQNGCSGGQIEYAYSHIQTNGLTTNYQYPYVSGQYPASNTTNGTNTTIDYMNYTGYSRACRFWTGYYKIASYNGPFYSDCVEVRKKLQERPISTAIRATNLQFYSQGVYNNCIRTEQFNHAVLLVGFNSSIGYKFKNSWGSTWGISGYGWVSANFKENCGVCEQPVFFKLPGE